jgi:hypothetical protein
MATPANAPCQGHQPQLMVETGARSDEDRLSKDEPAYRCVVVGYDGWYAARRAMTRSLRAAGQAGQVLLVSITPRAHSDGIRHEPLVEPGDPALAAALRRPRRRLADMRNGRAHVAKEAPQTRSWTLREPPNPDLRFQDVRPRVRWAEPWLRGRPKRPTLAALREVLGGNQLLRVPVRADTPSLEEAAHAVLAGSGGAARP